MNIVKNLVSSSKYNIKCPYSMNPEYIVVHNTANDASAQNEINYMISNNNEVSFHFAVDDKEVVQGLPLDRNGWHSSDGSNGPGNRKGIAVEICYSKSGGSRFDAAEINAAKLIAHLLKERNWNIDRVRTHQSFATNKKYCPHRTLDAGWDRFINLVKKELEAPVTSDNAEKQIFYRVICGSYLNKNTANTVKAKLEKQGYTGVFLEAIQK